MLFWQFAILRLVPVQSFSYLSYLSLARVTSALASFPSLLVVEERCLPNAVLGVGGVIWEYYYTYLLGVKAKIPHQVS